MKDGGSKWGFYGLAAYPVDGVSSRGDIGLSLGKAREKLAPESSRILIECVLLLIVNYLNFIALILVQMLLLFELFVCMFFLASLSISSSH